MKKKNKLKLSEVIKFGDFSWNGFDLTYYLEDLESNNFKWVSNVQNDRFPHDIEVNIYYIKGSYGIEILLDGNNYNIINDKYFDTSFYCHGTDIDKVWGKVCKKVNNNFASMIKCEKQQIEKVNKSIKIINNLSNKYFKS